MDNEALAIEPSTPEAPPSWVLPALIATVVALVISILALFIVGAQLDEVSHRADKTAKNNQASLCSFKNDLVDRNNESKKLLKQHPEIIEKFGLTKAQVADQQKNRQRTIDSLKSLKCPRPAPVLETTTGV